MAITAFCCCHIFHQDPSPPLFSPPGYRTAPSKTRQFSIPEGSGGDALGGGGTLGTEGRAVAIGSQGNLGAGWVPRVRPQQLCSHRGKSTAFSGSPSWDDPSDDHSAPGKPSPEPAAAVEAVGSSPGTQHSLLCEEHPCCSRPGKALSAFLMDCAVPNNTNVGVKWSREDSQLAAHLLPIPAQPWHCAGIHREHLRPC